MAIGITFIAAQQTYNSNYGTTCYNVLAPNGSRVAAHLSCLYDTRDEVWADATQIPSASLPLRALPNLDYAAHGFVKIGKVWVNPANESDVKRATDRCTD